MSKSAKNREALRAMVRNMVPALVAEVMMKINTLEPSAAAAGGSGPAPGTVQVPPAPVTEPADIKVEHGVPIPPRADHRRWEELLGKMQPQDSILASPTEARSFTYVVNKNGGRTVTRTVDHGGKPMVRVWLAEKKAAAA